MNYLQLAQRLVIESGASGSNTTVVSATGEWLRMVTWINQAWIDIQNECPDWRWMRKTKSFATITNQAEYTIDAAPLSLTNFASWVDRSFRIYTDSAANEKFLDQLAYDNFRDTYMLGSLRTSYAQPTAITVSPTNSLILALPPDGTNHTIIGDYNATANSLTLDADEPDMPDRYHIAIVWKALMHYGARESYPDAYSRGETEFNRLLAKMHIDQRPPLTIKR